MIDSPETVRQRTIRQEVQKLEDLKEGIIIKLNAHRHYINRSVMDFKRFDVKSFDRAVNIIIDAIKDSIILPEPSQVYELIKFEDLDVAKKTETEKRLKSLYEDIYNSLTGRYFGRTGSFYLEKLF